MRYDLTPSSERIPLVPQLALDTLLNLWSGDTLYEIGCSLTCSEAEALAEVFAAYGEHSKADALRRGHITGDDSGDLNHNTGGYWTDEELEALPESAHDTSCVHGS